MGHDTASMKRVRGIAGTMEGRMGWTTERPIKPGWYWVKLLGRITVIEIREYDLLLGGRLGLDMVQAWQGPI